MIFGAGLGIGGVYFLFKDGSIGVSTGEIKYSANGVLRADGVSACSVIIIGDERGAVMAHAFPENVLFLHREKRITIENAVKECVAELARRKIGISECDAVVNAGTRAGYDRLVGDLNKQKIRIRGAYLEEGGRARNVNYNIGKKEAVVEYIK